MFSEAAEAPSLLNAVRAVSFQPKGPTSRPALSMPLGLCRRSLVSTIIVEEHKDGKAWIKSKREVKRNNHSCTMCKITHFAGGVKTFKRSIRS